MNLFDKFFGTYKPLEEDIKIEYSITKWKNSNNPIKISTRGYESILKDVKASRNLKETFIYIFGPPGRSPNGKTLTTRQMQKSPYLITKKHF